MPAPFGFFCGLLAQNHSLLVPCAPVKWKETSMPETPPFEVAGVKGCFFVCFVFNARDQAEGLLSTC